jgi:hypothetical protein
MLATPTKFHSGNPAGVKSLSNLPRLFNKSPFNHTNATKKPSHMHNSQESPTAGIAQIILASVNHSYPQQNKMPLEVQKQYPTIFR